MQIKNVSLSQLNAALRAVNRSHGYQLIWNRAPEALNAKGTRFACTIRSKVSGIKGSRTSSTGRKLVSASWHAHGFFFESILAYAPNAVIRIGRNSGKVDQHGGNWRDFNIGSQMSPCMASSTSIGE